MLALLPFALAPQLAPLSRCVPSPRASTALCSAPFDRRSALLSAALIALPQSASAMIESTNPANNYYFPMAKYRYLPRIFRAWVAVDELAPVALEVGDWEGMNEVVRRADDAVTALPLYTSAVEGSRSTKRKKKSEAQKQMTQDLQVYSKSLEEMKASIKKKDKKKTEKLLADVRSSLLDYRQLAQIDKPDGGVITLPLGNAEEVRPHLFADASRRACPKPRSVRCPACHVVSFVCELGARSLGTRELHWGTWFLLFAEEASAWTMRCEQASR
ncbi:MAG: hypothetical protein SGPRY_006146 [Prymnesium sp.]